MHPRFIAKKTDESEKDLKKESTGKNTVFTQEHLYNNTVAIVDAFCSLNS